MAYKKTNYNFGFVKYGPGGQTTDGCGPGFSKSPFTGDCIPNGWMPPTQTQAGPTNQAAENIRRARMFNDAHEIAAKARYKQLQPNQGQQATVGRSYGDDPWRQRQAAEIRRQEAMKNTELAQSFAGLTPSGDINAGVIGANTFANMTPGIGIIPASARLATAFNSAGINNPRQGENAYYSPSNSFGENAFGALNFVGDIGMLGIGSPFKGVGAEPTPGVYQSGFNPIKGTKKFINKAYGAFDEMFGGSGDDVLFSDIQNKPATSKAASSKAASSSSSNYNPPTTKSILDKLHDDVPLTDEEYYVYQNVIENDKNIQADWRADRIKRKVDTDPFLNMPRRADGSYYGKTSGGTSIPFRNYKTVEHNGKTYHINTDNPAQLVEETSGGGLISVASDAVVDQVLDKYNKSIPVTTTPEPVQQTTTTPTAQQTAPPAQTQTGKPPVSTLEQNLNKARAQSNPNPPASPTEKNTGQAAPATTTPKKGSSLGQFVKPVLKGAGVLGGIGLGMYGMNRMFSNSAPPTKPFSNSPTNNTVAPSDTMFYTPPVDTSMNQYADTTRSAVPASADTNINAPLTQQEIQQALDTSGIHRYGGQRMMYGGYPRYNNGGMFYRFQNGGSISIEGLQNALNNIKI